MRLIILLALTCLAFGVAQNTFADEVNDLFQFVMDSSPQEKSKLESYKKSIAKKPQKSAKKVESKSKTQPIIPEMGIPESQLLDASAKFPKDINGKYIYGTVTFKAVGNYTGEPHIQFASKNGRIYIFYTRDQALLNAFSHLTWGTKFTIPKECPLRLLSRDLLPGSYIVRLPYDMSSKDYTFGEMNRESGDSLKKNLNEIGDSFRELGEIFQNPAAQ